MHACGQHRVQEHPEDEYNDDTDTHAHILHDPVEGTDVVYKRAVSWMKHGVC